MLFIRNLSEHWAIILVLIVFICLAVIYSVVVPIFEPPDEEHHYLYIRHLVNERCLPVQLEDGPRSHSYQPPLYYLIGAMATFWVRDDDLPFLLSQTNPYWGYRHWEVGDDNKNRYLHGDWEGFPYSATPLGVHIVRLLSILMGAGTVFITYLVAREVFPKRPSIAIGAMAFVAFNPKFIFISGAVHNDNLATFLSSLAILCSLRLVRMGESALRGFLLGTILGLSLLAKLSSLPLLPVIGVAALLTAIRQRSKMAFVRSALAIFIIAAIISGWWFVRNIFVYGEPTGIKVTLKVWQGERPPDYKLYLSLLELPHAWISFWGKFGMGQIPIPSAIHSALGWIAGAAGVGFSIFIYQQLKWKVFGAVNFMQLLILLAHLLFSLAALVGYISLTVAGSMGRFLFPAFSAIGTLFFFGLSRLIPKNLIGILAAAVNLGLASLSVICLLFYLIPAYVKPPLLSQEEIEAIPNPLDVEFGGVMKLLGYEIEKEQVRPGEKLSITLYWESLAKMERNWSVFVHLLDEEGIIVAQRDTYPGLGRYPTTIWAVGDSIADRYAIAIPETAFSPTRASIEVGLYYLPTGERLLASSEEGKVLGDSVQLGWIEIVPREGDFPNPLRLEFDGRIALLGYELERRSAYPGESVRLTLYWQALSKMKENYTVFVHLLREGDQIWAGVDKELSPPTSTWEKGEVIVEEYELVISPDAPADVYEMEIGLYPPDMSRRLRVKWDGTWADRVFLSKIRVVERLPSASSYPSCDILLGDFLLWPREYHTSLIEFH